MTEHTVVEAAPNRTWPRQKPPWRSGGTTVTLSRSAVDWLACPPDREQALLRTAEENGHQGRDHAVPNGTMPTGIVMVWPTPSTTAHPCPARSSPGAPKSCGP